MRKLYTRVKLGPLLLDCFASQNSFLLFVLSYVDTSVKEANRIPHIPTISTNEETFHTEASKWERHAYHLWQIKIRLSIFTTCCQLRDRVIPASTLHVPQICEWGNSTYR